MPLSEETVRMIRRKAYQDALKNLDDLILATPSGAVRNKLTEANIALIECKNRQEQLDQHG